MEHSIFAMELCFRLEPGSALRDTLDRLVRNHPATSSASQKWTLYRDVRKTLATHIQSAVSGCWDYFDSDQKALDDYETWTQSMVTREGARKAPSGPPVAYVDTGRFLTFTMCFLIENGAPSERDVFRLCDIPEDRLWRRETFATMLRALGVLSFASVRSDVVYLIPGDASWALTADDLQDPKFHYLRPLVD